MKSELEKIIGRYRELAIDQQLNYDKFYLYSIITHSTAIEGSTITELENQIMFDNGIALKGKSIIEQNMNLDLKQAYDQVLKYARQHSDITIERLKKLSALTMKNTGTEYHTALGDFSSANGDLRLVNVTAGVGGKSYMAFNKVPQKLKEFCDELNNIRRHQAQMSIQELYNMSFDAHFKLVTIHPWADGNGRMARLLMNWLQFESGVIPSRILSEDKEEYIKALVATRENDDLNIFRQYMTDTMVAHLTRDIYTYLESIGVENAPHEISKTTSTKNRIIELLRQNPKHTARSLSEIIGISPKGIERQIKTLKTTGVLRRIGPDKGGEWEILI